MRDVLLALLFHVRVLLSVIVAIGHPKSALHRLRDIVRAVFCIGPRAKIEKRVDAYAVQVRDLLQHVLWIFDRIDFLELLGQRLCARSFDRLVVHSACVVIADFLCFRCQLRIDWRLRCLRGDGVQ